MYEISIDCKKCGLCKKNCVCSAIDGEVKKFMAINQKKCEQCGLCYEVCPFSAVLKDGILKPKIKGKKKKSLKSFIDKKECLGCKNCYLNCPNEVIKFNKSFFGGFCSVEEEKCKGCGLCLKMCLNNCIRVLNKKKSA